MVDNYYAYTASSQQGANPSIRQHQQPAIVVANIGPWLKNGEVKSEDRLLGDVTSDVMGLSLQRAVVRARRGRSKSATLS